ncbi:MAG: hypothetical protein ICV63_14335 [Coleofasciculus sp. Co-bin14]|nr:hypothetical protein [Coleofasciculus sp. Co-bin14]
MQGERYVNKNGEDIGRGVGWGDGDSMTGEERIIELNSGERVPEFDLKDCQTEKSFNLVNGKQIVEE